MKISNYLARQNGAALITSLIFLTVLTILGMSTLGTALLESRMAGNARDRNMAFQAAEIGLRDAELYIRDSGRIVGLTEVGTAGEGYCETTACTAAMASAGTVDNQLCKHGLCDNGGTMKVSGTAWYAVNNAVWMQEALWANAIQYQRDDANVGKGIGDPPSTTKVPIINATYVLPPALPLVRRQPEYLIESFQKDDSRRGNAFYYRISVRGYGMRSGTRVMLQEVYKPE